MTLFHKLRGAFRTLTDRSDPSDSKKSAGALQAFVAGIDNDNSGGLADPYNLSPWVSRAIKHISGPIAQVELEFSEATGGGQIEIEDPALAAFWASPAKGMGARGRLSRFDAIEATVGWLCLRGEFFWLLDDTWLTNSAAKSPFLIARPDRMRPITDDGELVGWSYTDASGLRHEVIPDQVVTSRFWNPADDLRGAAPMSAARQAAESDYATGRYWKSLSESNGDRGETVIAPNGISPEQEAQVVRALRAKRAASKRGKFQPMFLVGDLKTEDAKIQAPDAASVTQRLQSRHEIFIAFGVPPSFAEVTASYSIGSASDRYKLIEETCMPIAAKIAEACETVTSRLLRGRRVSVSFCFDDHSTMQQVRSERIEAGRKLHERGVPWDVISDHLKLDLPPFPGSDKAWLPFNLQPVAAATATEPDLTPEPAPGQEAMKCYQELEALLRCPCHSPSSSGLLPPVSKSSASDALWQRHMKVRAPHLKRMRAIVDKAIFQARKETLSKLAAADKTADAARSGAFDFLFDLVDFLKVLVQPMFAASTDAYAAAGADLLEHELPDYAAPFISTDPAGLELLRQRENFVKDAGTDMWGEIRDELDAGLQAGESFAKLSQRLRSRFNDMSKERAMRIAVTETGIAFESARHAAMVQAGVQWKTWLTSEDDRVRLSHASANNRVVPIDEPFVIGGSKLMHPCDPAGPAAEIINCRCVHGPSSSPPDPSDIEGNNPTAPIPF
jgi:phage portal protein BeeE